jgi:hypothetical protein
MTECPPLVAVWQITIMVRHISPEIKIQSIHKEGQFNISKTEQTIWSIMIKSIVGFRNLAAS